MKVNVDGKKVLAFLGCATAALMAFVSEKEKVNTNATINDLVDRVSKLEKTES